MKWAKHDEVIELVKQSDGVLEMEVITPQNIVRVPVSHLENTLKVRKMSSRFSKDAIISPTSTTKSSRQRTRSGKR